VSEVLSQQEIDRLLTKIKDGDVKEEKFHEIVQNTEVYEYDFRQPTRVSKDQLKTIRTLHETFAELFGFYLASRLQTMASIQLIDVDQLRYSEYVLSLANPSSIYIFDVVETQGRAVMEITPELVYVIVERLLGGSGSKPRSGRGVTAIEQRLMNPIIAQALSNLASVWKPIYHLTFKLSGFESNPDFVQIAPASEIVIVTTFQVKIGTEEFLMNICYPSFTLEDVIAHLNVQLFTSGFKEKKQNGSRHKISFHLSNTLLPVRTLLGKTQLTLRELLELETGDIIRLDKKIDEPVSVYVSDRLKYYGRPGVVDGHVAVKISTVLENEIYQKENKNG